MHRFAQSLLLEQGLSDWSVFWVYSLEDAHGGGVTRAHTRRIVFSAAYLAMMSPSERRDAVRHEVAHVLAGVAAGHSQVWRDRAIALGSTGSDSISINGLLYPWYGFCPDDHPFVSLDPPGSAGFVCEDDAHDEPEAVTLWKRNPKSRAFDPGVHLMVEAYLEPVSKPAFKVGDTVYIVPFGDKKYDNASVRVVKVSSRMYITRHLATDEEIPIAFDAVTDGPELI